TRCSGSTPRVRALGTVVSHVASAATMCAFCARAAEHRHPDGPGGYISPSWYPNYPQRDSARPGAFR
ncbi:hypothetical protein ACFODQ_02160, partial [Comamonas sp. JC664]